MNLQQKIYELETKKSLALKKAMEYSVEDKAHFIYEGKAIGLAIAIKELKDVKNEKRGAVPSSEVYQRGKR